MIKIVVEDYCNNCPEFVASQQTTNACTVDGSIRIIDHFITCEHKYKCRNIVKHIEKELKNS